MQKISLPWMLQVMSSIDRLHQITAGQTRQEISYLCFDAGQNLTLIFDESIYRTYLNISRERASTLKTSLTEMRPLNAEDSRQVSELEEWMIKYHSNQFREVFLAELNILPSFLVMEKEGYDIDILIHDGSKLFPPSILQKCPESAPDMNEASKALAFELPTACGFHVFRVTEAVLKRYWDHVSSGKDRSKLHSIGSYAKELEKQNYGEKKIWEALKQLADLHRNPVIHPEAILDVEEAIETLGIARSVIGAMLRVMPEIQLTTTPQPT